MRTHLLALVGLALVVVPVRSAPAEAHSATEVEAWLAEWSAEAEAGLTPELVAELEDFRSRHVCHFRTCVRAPVVVRQPPQGALTEAEMRELVGRHFPEWLVEEALAVSWCESRWRPGIRRRGGTDSGLFQFIRGTWDWVASQTGTGSHASGAPFDPEANVRNAAWLVNYSIEQGHWRWTHWVCQP